MGQMLLCSFQCPNSPQQQNIQMHTPVLPYHMPCCYWPHSEIVFTNHRIPDFLSKVPDSVRNSHRENGCGSNKDPCNFVLFYPDSDYNAGPTPTPAAQIIASSLKKDKPRESRSIIKSCNCAAASQSLLPCIVALVGSENRGMSKR